MKLKIVVFVMILAICGLCFNTCFADSDLQVEISNMDAKVSFQEIDKDTILVSALNSDGDPVTGLMPDDFIVQRGLKKAKITAAEVLETREDVSMNIVLIIDNSFSMKQRKAIQPLLSALDEFLKILRPFDTVDVVTFNKKKKFDVDGHNLRIDTFQSNSKIELKNFFQQKFEEKLSDQTFLYEGILAGLHLISQMPENSNKFLVTFSDGEDLNSAIKTDVLDIKAKGLKNFNAYTIDFMPSEEGNEYLKTFSEANGGNVWKATSANNLLPIFKKVSTTLLHRYVVDYQFLNPPGGSLSLGVKEITIDALTTLDGRPIPYYVFFDTGKSTINSKYHLFAENNQTRSFNEKGFSNVMDKYFSVLNLTGKTLLQNPTASIRIIGCNSDQGVEKSNLKLSQNRADAVMSYLHDIWKIDNSRMHAASRELPEISASADVQGSRSENQRVEIVFDQEELQKIAENSFTSGNNNTNNLVVLPHITSEYGIAEWELAIKSKNEVIKNLKGKEAPLTQYSIAVNEMDINNLSDIRYLEAAIKVTDINGDTFETTSEKCLINVSSTAVIHQFITGTKGSISVKPDSLTIEEVTIIDSSPLLNYVFFNNGESKIPIRYKLLQSQVEAKAFDEKKLQNTMAKYQNVLNIIGKRFLENPSASIELVGCISNRGKEKNRVALSQARAEEVRAYLRYIWGINPDRIKVTARKLPAVPSTNSVEKGRVENQRVEIYSDSPEILDSIKSTYSFAMANSDELKIHPDIQPGYDLKEWSIDIKGNGTLLKSKKGEGNNIPDFSFNLKEYGLNKMVDLDNIAISATMTDIAGNTFTTDTANTSVKYVKRVEREVKKLGYKVMEKYALILFDYNSSEIKERNKIVLNRVVKRIRELPKAMVTIVGHSDIIGKEAYNVALSMRRAKAVHKQLLNSNIPSPDQIIYRGDGPYNPPYDNDTAEGRSFNRTVTITIEYESN